MFTFNLFNNMKPTAVLMILLPTLMLSFVSSYFLELTLKYWDQYTSIAFVIMLDGFFGVISGCKREGLKTYKALRIIKSLFSWLLIMFTVLMIEKTYPLMFWLSECFFVPIIVFYLISTLKNASDAGFIRNDYENFTTGIDNQNPIQECQIYFNNYKI